MGGLFSTPQVVAPGPVDYTPILKEMELQREELAAQQKANEEAQRSSISTSQNTAASQAADQAAFNARQGLGRQEAYQQAMDFMANEQAKKSAAMAGQQQTGGPINIVDSSQAKMSALNAASSKLPQTAANMAGGFQNYPGMKSAPSSSFSMPNTSGLNFGGY